MDNTIIVHVRFADLSLKIDNIVRFYSVSIRILRQKEEEMEKKINHATM